MFPIICITSVGILSIYTSGFTRASDATLSFYNNLRLAGVQSEEKNCIMKNLGKIAMMFLLGLSCVNFVACSDEENTEETSVVPVTVNPSNVFVNGLPKEAEGLTFIYNTDGLLTSISEKEGSDRVSFDYSTLNQSKIQMVIYDSYGTYILDMTIGDNGFVSDCVESGPYGNDTWSFGYTASEQLNYMKRSEGGGRDYEYNL